MSRPRVAIVRGFDRRGAVAHSLELIRGDLEASVDAASGSDVLIKPNLVSHRHQPASTHADAFAATLDAVLARGAERVIVAEGASDATAGFERFGLRGVAWGRPVRFLDLNRDETEWVPLELVGLDGRIQVARLSRTVAECRCRVSLALPKTHVLSSVTLGLKNMLSSIHPEDRALMHGHARGGNGFRGWKKTVVDILKRDDMAIRFLTRALGRVRSARNLARGLGRPDGHLRLSSADRAFLRSVGVLHTNLVRLARAVRPHVTVIDGYVGMHREGPRHGSPFRWGVAFAGTDAVAVDAVTASAMGFDPNRIGFLAGAADDGLGPIDLREIEIVGESLVTVRRRFVPHSNDAVGRHLTFGAGPGPATLHQRPIRVGTVSHQKVG